jgi:hypothetical protein
MMQIMVLMPCLAEHLERGCEAAFADGPEHAPFKQGETNVEKK